MSERKSAWEMVGELLRDAGLLTAVFLPLDLYVGQRLTVSLAVVTIVVPVALIAAGIIVELKRK